MIEIKHISRAFQNYVFALKGKLFCKILVLCLQ